MKVTYQASTYSPELVTGVYVRKASKYDLPEGITTEKPMFKVIEAETCWKKGQFYGKAGMGYTLREYVTTGEEIPQEVKERCIKSKSTEKWS